jgi:hypothetical protein
MHTVIEYRRENLRKLIELNGGVGVLGRKLGYTNGSFIVQMAGPMPTREVTEATARAFEAKLGLEAGWLDFETVVPPGQASAAENRKQKTVVAGPRDVVDLLPAPDSIAPARYSDENLTDLVRLIGGEADKLGLSLPTAKFADIIALTLADARGRGGSPDINHVQMLLKLAK